MKLCIRNDCRRNKALTQIGGDMKLFLFNCQAARRKPSGTNRSGRRPPSLPATRRRRGNSGAVDGDSDEGVGGNAAKSDRHVRRRPEGGVGRSGSRFDRQGRGHAGD